MVKRTITKIQKYILYSLGKWIEEANKKVSGKPLIVSISKIRFIELMKKSDIVSKEIRALYKNLEVLEKKKLINYKYKELELTAKGKKQYEKIKRELEPYLDINNKLEGKKALIYARKIQTLFKK